MLPEPCCMVWAPFGTLGYQYQFGSEGGIGSEPYATWATVCPLGILLCCAQVASLCWDVLQCCVCCVLCTMYYVLCVVCAVCVMCCVCYVCCVLCRLCVTNQCVSVIKSKYFGNLFGNSSNDPPFYWLFSTAKNLTFLVYPCYNTIIHSIKRLDTIINSKRR